VTGFWQTVLAWLPHKTIKGECVAQRGPLMDRWFIFRSPVCSLMVHRFNRSDADRHFHDHPWAFITFLMSSGYWEHTPKGRFWRRQFSVLYRPATWQHWVELNNGQKTWTLVLKFRTVREWGFITSGGWVYWRDLDFEPICNEYASTQHLAGGA